MEEVIKQELKKEPTSAIDAATALLAQIKAENDRRENILKEEQKLRAEQMLAGTAGGGLPRIELTEEQKKKQEALDFWKGTAIADAIAKHNG